MCSCCAAATLRDDPATALSTELHEATNQRNGSPAPAGRPSRQDGRSRLIAMLMHMITAYHTGDLYSLEPLHRSARCTRLLLHDGVRIRESAARELLVCGPGFAYGVPVRIAAKRGWCRGEDAPPPA